MNTISIPGAFLGLLLLAVSHCDRDPPKDPGPGTDIHVHDGVSVNGKGVYSHDYVIPAKKAPKQ